MNAPPSSPEDLPFLHAEVHRLVGRCILNLQVYELLLKRVLAQHDLAGPAENWEAQIQARTARYSKVTLGELAKLLFASYVVPENVERADRPDDVMPPLQIHLEFRQAVIMPPEQLEATRIAVAELVEMRNELVHGLHLRFDLNCASACQAATVHLEALVERIALHLRELRGWMAMSNRLTEEAIACVHSPAFDDQLRHGISHEGSFDWQAAGIVHWLRKAAAELSDEGWVSLERAASWIAGQDPDMLPTKYGCRTWQQVVQEAREFELRHRTGVDGQKERWYRVRRKR